LHGHPNIDTSFAFNAGSVSGIGISPTFSYTVTAIDAEPLPGGFAGDFNDDGRSDLLRHIEKTGDSAMWLVNGLAFLGGDGLVSNTAWRPTHIADFNGDGMARLIWRNSAAGKRRVGR
jgi:hypothetical protein